MENLMKSIKQIKKSIQEKINKHGYAIQIPKEFGPVIRIEPLNDLFNKFIVYNFNGMVKARPRRYLDLNQLIQNEYQEEEVSHV
jgi:hypothetical protein